MFAPVFDTIPFSYYSMSEKKVQCKRRCLCVEDVKKLPENGFRQF